MTNPVIGWLPGSRSEPGTDRPVRHCASSYLSDRVAAQDGGSRLISDHRALSASVDRIVGSVRRPMIGGRRTELFQPMPVTGRLRRCKRQRYSWHAGPKLPRARSYRIVVRGPHARPPPGHRATGPRHPNCGDERVPERVTRDGLADSGAARDLADDPLGAVPVQPPPARERRGARSQVSVGYWCGPGGTAILQCKQRSTTSSTKRSGKTAMKSAFMRIEPSQRPEPEATTFSQIGP